MVVVVVVDENAGRRIFSKRNERMCVKGALHAS